MSGWTDNVFMRFMDVLLAFPALLLAIAIVTAAGPSLINALIAIGIVAIPVYARVMRASVLASEGERLRDGVAGARRVDVRRPRPADHAQLADAARRGRHARHRRRGPRGRGPLLPRA